MGGDPGCRCRRYGSRFCREWREGGYKGLAGVLHRCKDASTLSRPSTAAPGRTTARGLPGYESYTNVYQTGRDGRVGERVGSAAPLGLGRTVLESASRPNICHVQWDGGCSSSSDGLDAYKGPIWVYLCLRHIFRTLDHIQLVVPGPRWFRQGNTAWHVEASKSLNAVYKPRYFTGSMVIAVARFTTGHLPTRREITQTKPPTATWRE